MRYARVFVLVVALAAAALGPTQLAGLGSSEGIASAVGIGSHERLPLSSPLGQPPPLPSASLCKLASPGLAAGSLAGFDVSGNVIGGRFNDPVVVTVSADCEPSDFTPTAASFERGQIITITETAPTGFVLVGCVATQGAGGGTPLPGGCQIVNGTAQFFLPVDPGGGTIRLVLTNALPLPPAAPAPGAAAATGAAPTPTPPPVIPELSTMLMFGSGLAGLGGYALTRARATRRRRRRGDDV